MKILTAPIGYLEPGVRVKWESGDQGFVLRQEPDLKATVALIEESTTVCRVALVQSDTVVGVGYGRDDRLHLYRAVEQWAEAEAKQEEGYLQALEEVVRAAQSFSREAMQVMSRSWPDTGYGWLPEKVGLLRAALNKLEPNKETA